MLQSNKSNQGYVQNGVGVKNDSIDLKNIDVEESNSVHGPWKAVGRTRAWVSRADSPFEAEHRSTSHITTATTTATARVQLERQ